MLFTVGVFFGRVVCVWVRHANLYSHPVLIRNAGMSVLFLPIELWDVIIHCNMRVAGNCFSVSTTFHALARDALQQAPPLALLKRNAVPSFESLERIFLVEYGTARALRDLYLTKKRLYETPCKRGELPLRHLECLQPLCVATGGLDGLIKRIRQRRRKQTLVTQARAALPDLLYKDVDKLCGDVVSQGGGIAELMVKVNELAEERRLKQIAEREEAEAARAEREQRRIQLELEEAARKEAARPFYEELRGLATDLYPRSLCRHDMERLCWRLAYGGLAGEDHLFRAVKRQRCLTHDYRCTRVFDGQRCKGRGRSTANAVCEGCLEGAGIFV